MNNMYKEDGWCGCKERKMGVMSRHVLAGGLTLLPIIILVLSFLVLVLAIASTSSEASEVTYRTEYGGQWIKLISSSELEYHTGDATFLCKYSTQQGTLRVIMGVLGTQQVLYFRRTSAGLVSEDGRTFFNPTALAEHRRQQEAARQAREKAEQKAQQEAAARRAEQERIANDARLRETEARRQVAERKLQIEIKALESTDCPEGKDELKPVSRTFVVSSKRECWTPWLQLPDYGGYRWEVSGDILVQATLHKSMFPTVEAVDGPGKVFPTEGANIVRARFKSLGREPVTVTIVVIPRRY